MRTRRKTIMVTYTRVSLSVVRGSHRIHDQFPGDPWIQFRNGDYRVCVLLKIIKKRLCHYVYFVRPLEYLIMKLPVPTKPATVS